MPRGRFRGTTGSTGCPGPLGPVSEVPRLRPAVSGDHGQGPWALGVPQLSRAPRTVPEGSGVEQLPLATRACVRGPPGSTSGPGRLRPGSRDRGVDHRSQATPAGAQGPAGSTISPGPLGFWSKVLRLTRCPGRPGPMPEGTRGRPDVPGDSGQAPSACGVDRLSRGSRARFRGPERSTDCPMGIEPLPKGPWGPPAVPGHSRLGPKALGVDELPQETPARLRVPVVSPSCPLGTRGHSRGPAESTSCPGCLGPYPRARVSKSCPGRPARVSGDPRSTSYPRRLGLEPDVPWGRPALPGDSGPVRRDRGVDQLSRTPRAQARGSSVSTSCAVRHGPGSEGPWVDQLPLANGTVVRGPAGTTSCPVRIWPGSEALRV